MGSRCGEKGTHGRHALTGLLCHAHLAQALIMVWQMREQDRTRVFQRGSSGQNKARRLVLAVLTAALVSLGAYAGSFAAPPRSEFTATGDAAAQASGMPLLPLSF